MNLLTVSFQNTIRNLVRNKLISFVCLGIIAFTLLIFGIFNYITFNLGVFSNKFSKNIEAIFYFNDGITNDQIEVLTNKIQESLLVKEVIFKSTNQAESEFSRQFPELKYLLSEFKESPFPASLEVKFSEKYNLNTQVSSFIDEIEKLSIIESKQVNTDWAKKIITIKKFISVAGIFLSIILIFISIFIIFNIIKLNIFYRHEEINILKLVGATNWYIKFPFIIEGALLGFVGSLISLILLFSVLKLFPTYATFISSFLKEIINFRTIPLKIYLQIVLLGTGIGLFSSIFSANRFLK